MPTPINPRHVPPPFSPPKGPSRLSFPPAVYVAIAAFVVLMLMLVIAVANRPDGGTDWRAEYDAAADEARRLEDQAQAILESLKPKRDETGEIVAPIDTSEWGDALALVDMSDLPAYDEAIIKLAAIEDELGPVLDRARAARTHLVRPPSYRLLIHELARSVAICKEGKQTRLGWYHEAVQQAHSMRMKNDLDDGLFTTLYLNGTESREKTDANRLRWEILEMDVDLRQAERQYYLYSDLQ